MLVSPIMGPILAVTFGTMIRRPTMIKKALRNEAISLLLCVLTGALYVHMRPRKTMYLITAETFSYTACTFDFTIQRGSSRLVDKAL